MRKSDFALVIESPHPLLGLASPLLLKSNDEVHRCCTLHANRICTGATLVTVSARIFPRRQGFIQCMSVHATAPPATREKMDHRTAQHSRTAQRHESVVSFLCSSWLPLDLKMRPSSNSDLQSSSLRSRDSVSTCVPLPGRGILWSLSNRASWAFATDNVLQLHGSPERFRPSCLRAETADTTLNVEVISRILLNRKHGVVPAWLLL